MILPRSPEAVAAFWEAQDGLGESPSNVNWMTRATHFDGSPWCSIGDSLAHIAAGFNAEGKILDFGSPDRPPSWGNSVPDLDGIGFDVDYRWGDAWTWSWRDAAARAGRWHGDLDDWAFGDTLLVNHNGRGRARDSNSHTCWLIGRDSQGFLTWNGNISNRVRTAYWTPDVVEGFARPAYLSASPIPPADLTEDDMAYRFTHKGSVYVSDGLGRRRITTPGINDAMARAKVRGGTEVWPLLDLDGGHELQDDVFNTLVDLDR